VPALIPGDSSQYPTEIQTPVDGDTANAASVSTGLAQLADRTANLNARLVSGGGGGGAPTDATYLVASSNSTLTNETVVPAAGLTLLAAVDAAAQRLALGLGSAATANTGDFDAAGAAAAAQAASLQKSSNLSDLASAATARTNLGLGSAATKDAGSPSGVATLDSGGKIPSSQLPSIAITETFVVASQAAMLALTAERGDVAIRTDISTSFILSSDSPSTLADWKELLTPADGVTSFNGRTGAVSPAPGDYTASDVGALAAASNLGDLDDAATARGNLGLGGAAVLDVGTTAGTVAAGDDSRLSNARTPTSHASSHQNGGSDEIATATPGANAIPKAGAGGTLASGWLPPASTSAQGAIQLESSGDTSKFLNGNGAWTTPVGSVPVEASGAVGNILTNGFTTMPGILSYTTGTGLSTAALRARPVVFGRSGTLTQLGMVCATGVATAKARIGLYDSDANGGPGTLLVDSGEFDCASNGRKLTTGLSVAISAGKVYWFAAIGGTAAPNLALISTAVFMNAMVAASGATAGSVCVAVSVAQSYGALPGTFPAGYTAQTAVNLPIPLFTVTP